MGSVGHRFVPGAALSTVLAFVVRWGRTRARALRLFRGVVRGTAVVWPQEGRAWAMGQDVPRPARGQVLVRVVASAVSPGTERAFFTRLPNAVLPFPLFPGYSVAGEIVEVGDRMTRWRPGDRVALAAPHASAVVAAESEVFLVPQTVALEEAAFVQLGIIALHAVRKARLVAGESLVVLGHGLIGQLLVELGSAFSYPVISVSRTVRRQTDALVRAAQRVIILEQVEMSEIEELAAVTFDATGSPEGLPLALRCTGKGGRVVLAGSTRGVTERADFGSLADKGLTIVGAHISSLPRSDRLELAGLFLQLLERRRIDVASLISQRVHPLEAEWFYRRLSGKDDNTIGAVFCWDRLSPAQRMRRVSYITPPDLTPFRRARMATVPFSERLALRSRWTARS